jgi:hypothetical protein
MSSEASHEVIVLDISPAIDYLAVNAHPVHFHTSRVMSWIGWA